MARPETYHIQRLKALGGDALVTYPYGSTQWKRVERVYRVSRSQGEQPFLQTDAEYTGTTMVEQHIVGGDHIYVEIYQKYETLPGPILVDVRSHESGVSLLTAKQRRLGTDLFATGEITPSTINVTAISIAAGGITTVTLDAAHGLPPYAFVAFGSTNSTPNLNGTQQIVGVPADNQVQIGVNVTVTGNAGTMVALHRIQRERLSTGNLLVNVKVDTMIAIADPSTKNEDFGCWKDYSFPDFMLELNFYRDTATSTSVGDGAGYNMSWGGALGIPIQPGYRGPCKARRQRFFFSGPPPDSFWADAANQPTIIIPSAGYVVTQSGSESFKVSGSSTSLSESNSFHPQRIGPFLTGPSPAINYSPHGILRSGQATVSLDMVESTPTHFTKDDIITIIGQPQKQEAALWVVERWQVIVPYTSGSAP